MQMTKARSGFLFNGPPCMERRSNKTSRWTV